MTTTEKLLVELLAEIRGEQPTPATTRKSGGTTRKSKQQRVEQAYYALKAKTPKHDRPKMRADLGFVYKGRGETRRMETCREWVKRIGVNDAAKALKVK